LQKITETAKMVAGTGMKIVKYLMFFFNLIFLLAGLAMIIIGAVAQAASSSKFHGVYARNDGAIFIMVIGGIIFIVAFFGCCGAIKENRCLLITFGIMMSVILILSIAAIITAFVYTKRTKPWLTELMHDQLVRYGTNDKISDQQLAKTFWDNTQQNDHCCGINNLTDWHDNAELNKTQSLPDSCCRNNTAGCGFNYFVPKIPTIPVWNATCYETMRNDFQNKMLYVGAIACCVAILQVIGIILACSLAHAIHKGYNVVS